MPREGRCPMRDWLIGMAVLTAVLILLAFVYRGLLSCPGRRSLAGLSLLLAVDGAAEGAEGFLREIARTVGSPTAPWDEWEIVVVARDPSGVLCRLERDTPGIKVITSPPLGAKDALEVGIGACRYPLVIAVRLEGGRRKPGGGVEEDVICLLASLRARRDDRIIGRA